MKKEPPPCLFCEGTGKQIIGWRNKTHAEKSPSGMLPKDNRLIPITRKCPHCEGRGR